MAWISEWMGRRFRRWLAARGVLGSIRPLSPPSDTIDAAVELDHEATVDAYLECAQILFERGRSTQGLCALLDVLRFDAEAVRTRIAALGDDGGRVLTAGLRACTQVPVAAAPTDGAMVSVVICSRDDARFRAVRTEYERALAGGPFEIIRIDDARSLSEGYNRGFARSSGDRVIFSHDDIHLLSPRFRSELLSALDRFDLIGVAGAMRLDGPQWISCPPEFRRQLVCYPPLVGGGAFGCAIDGPQDVRWHEGIQCLDGVFFAARRDAIAGLRFDEARYDGFHFYDLDFTYRAHLAGLRLAVCPRLGIMHASAGDYDSPDWRRYAEVFCEQYRLPMASLPPTIALSFASEGELRDFLAAYFAWQDALGSLPRRPEPASPGAPKVVLHVGCGDKTLKDIGPGFQSGRWREIRVDADPAAQPDWLGSLTDLSAIGSASVDAVFSSHTLEHLYWHEVPVALAEIRRVLRPGGFALAWVPDLQAAARWIAEDRLFETMGTSPFGPLTPFDMVFSHRGAVGRDKPYMAHHCGFTLTTLIAAHRQAGYASVAALPRIDGFDLQVLACPARLPDGLLRAMAAVHFQH